MPLRTPRRVVPSLVVGAALVMAAVLAYLVLPPRQTRDVAVPATSATPEEVVAAYLAALDAHDCDTAEALMQPGTRADAASWCDDVAAVTDVVVRAGFHEHGEQGRGSGGGGSGHAPPADAVDVPVTFDLRWRLGHGDGSLPGGPTTWGYVLERDAGATGSPWRIADQGTG